MVIYLPFSFLSQVNGKPVAHLQAKEVIALLRACPSEVQLLAKRPAFEIQVQQNPPGNISNHVGL